MMIFDRPRCNGSTIKGHHGRCLWCAECSVHKCTERRRMKTSLQWLQCSLHSSGALTPCTMCISSMLQAFCSFVRKIVRNPRCKPHQVQMSRRPCMQCRHGHFYHEPQLRKLAHFRLTSRPRAARCRAPRCAARPSTPSARASSGRAADGRPRAGRQPCHGLPKPGPCPPRPPRPAAPAPRPVSRRPPYLAQTLHPHRPRSRTRPAPTARWECRRPRGRPPRRSRTPCCRMPWAAKSSPGCAPGAQSQQTHARQARRTAVPAAAAPRRAARLTRARLRLCVPAHAGTCKQNDTCRARAMRQDRNECTAHGRQASRTAAAAARCRLQGLQLMVDSFASLQIRLS